MGHMRADHLRALMRFLNPATWPNSFNLRLALHQEPNTDGGGVLSLTWANDLDPKKIVCKFELNGTCSNTSCPDEHLRVSTTDKLHALRAVERLVPLFASLETAVVNRATLDAKLQIHGGSDPEKVVRAVMRNLCDRATKIPLGIHANSDNDNGNTSR